MTNFDLTQLSPIAYRKAVGAPMRDSESSGERVK
jgi:hypothetical protein